MTRTRPDLRAVSLVALALLLTLGAAAISIVDDSLDPTLDSIIWMITLVFASSGLVIAKRRPGNKIGWLFLAVAVATPFSSLTGAFADRWVEESTGPAWLGQTAVAYSTVSWIPFVLVPATFLLLLFPDGRLLSRRWRPVAWCAVAGIAGSFVTTLLAPGQLDDFPGLDNPYGVDSRWMQVLQGLSFVVLLVGVLGSAASLVIRSRRAAGAQRQQMKWIALAGTFAGVTLPLMIVLYDVVGQVVADTTIMLSILTLPTATALAIVRYRLYDVDVVINRALVYGSLSATLGGVYVGSVLLLQLLLSDLTQGSGLAVAASTLTVAALFGPVRSRIQGVVDRRFFRSSYDAARTVTLFGARLRDEVDLAALTADLQGVAEETMQPAHVSLWLRSRGDT